MEECTVTIRLTVEVETVSKKLVLILFKPIEVSLFFRKQSRINGNMPDVFGCFWPDRVQSEVLRSDKGIQLSLLGS